MANKRKTERLNPLSDWQTETIRMTIFHQGGEPKEPLINYWGKLTDEPHSDEITKPQEGVEVVKGPFGEGLLSIISQIHRNVFEIRWQASGKHLSEELGYPTIGNFETTLGSFNELVKIALKKRFISGVLRVAFGSVIQLPAKDNYTACSSLSKYLKRVKLDPQKSRDVLFRINERRDSILGMKGLYVNRLNTWTLAAFQPFSVGTQQFGKISHASQLELDVNTCQEYKKLLPKAKLQKIYDELAQMGVEIVMKGPVS